MAEGLPHILLCLFSLLLLLFCPLQLGKPLKAKKNKTEESVIKNKNLLPPDHLPGVKLERDGELNKKYHHEAFLGKLVKEGKLNFDDMDGYKHLIEIFHKVDTNNDHLVDDEEMKSWIHGKILEHFNEAKDSSKELFERVDIDRDGYATWEEYRMQLTEDKVKFVNRTDENGELVELDQLSSQKGKWEKADLNLDGNLDETEFFYFLHPEHNKQSIKEMAEEMIEGFDMNQDKVLTVEEFVQSPPGDIDDPEQAKEEEDYKNRRIAEFKESMDKDLDGVVTVKELEVYLDPKHPQHAANEAHYLISIADRNKDGKLNEKEMLLNFALFTGSSMANYAGYIHDEF